MNVDRLRQQLVAEEGRRNASYLDTEGLWTIGIGHHDDKIGPGMIWNDAMVDAVFAEDVAEKVAQIQKALPWFDKIDDVRQAVLVEMCFQMGLNGLLGFTHTLGAFRDQRWNDAAGGMLASKWAKQTPKRAMRMARQVEVGEWQS